MLIEKRDLSLKNPLAIRDQKRKLVLDWLLAFRFSSVEILGQLLLHTSNDTNRFLRQLLHDGYIQRFLNSYMDRKRLIMLTPAGANYLRHTIRHDPALAVVRAYRLHRYSKVPHDLAVQRAAVTRLDTYKHLIWDLHISIPEPFHRPDLLMQNLKDQWIAFEYERTRKDQRRIFISFHNHTQAILQRHYHGAYFLFDRVADLNYYLALFKESEWPNYDYNRRTGKYTTKGDPLLPDTIKNLRQCFLFIHEAARTPKS